MKVQTFNHNHKEIDPDPLPMCVSPSVYGESSELNDICLPEWPTGCHRRMNSMICFINKKFYHVKFCKKSYANKDAVQLDSDEWLHYYDNERTHQGKICSRQPWSYCRMENNSGRRSLNTRL